MIDNGILTGRSQVFPGAFELIVKGEDIADRQPRHAHIYYEVLYVREGYAFFSHRQSTELVIPGDLIVIWPGVAHSLLQCCSLSLFACSFTQGILDLYGRLFSRLEPIALLRQPGGAVCVRVDKSSQDAFGPQFEAMVREQQEKRVGWQEYMCMLLGRVLVGYARHAEWQVGADGVVKQDGEGVAMMPLALVRKVLSSIEQNCMEDISAPELAAMVGVNADYMARQFKLVTGMTPMECVRAYRMQRAYMMLRSGDRSVAEVATFTGFSEVSNFSRQFKSVMGMTPRQVRKG